MTGGGREAVGSFDLPRLETWNQIWLVETTRGSSFAYPSRSIDYKAGLASLGFSGSIYTLLLYLLPSRYLDGISITVASFSFHISSSGGH